MTTPAAERILEAKLALEQELFSPLYLVCRQYIAANSSGILPSQQRALYAQRLEQVLRRHYARVVVVMAGKRPPRQARIEDAAFSLRHMESLLRRARTNAGLILGGIDRDLARAAALAPPIDDGTGAPLKALGVELETKDKVRGATGYSLRARDWAQDAAAKLRQRAGGIANAETQGPAEEARFELAPDHMAGGRVMHRWRCMMDDRVRHPPRSRFNHFGPHGQTVGVREPFEVSGELLRFPGDTSLGASLGNVINCRCTAEYLLVRPDGSETDIDTLPTAPARRIRPRGERPGLGDNRPAYNPTSVVTLNAGTRARVILGNGELATLRVEQPGLVTVRVRGETIARAQYDGGQIVDLSVAPRYRDAGVEGLIRRSVEHSAGR